MQSRAWPRPVLVMGLAPAAITALSDDEGAPMASVVARAKAASSAAASVSREGLPSVAVHQGGGQKKEAKAKAKGKGKAKAKAKAKAKVKPDNVVAARPTLIWDCR